MILCLLFGYNAYVLYSYSHCGGTLVVMLLTDNVMIRLIKNE